MRCAALRCAASLQSAEATGSLRAWCDSSDEYHGLGCCSSDDWEELVCKAADGEPMQPTAEEPCPYAVAVRKNRFNPEREFAKYRCGFNPSERAYWASLATTGLPAYVVAALLVLLVVLQILFALGNCVCCQSILPKAKAEGYSRSQVMGPKISMLVFCAFTAIGCFLTYAGGANAGSQVKNAVSILSHSARSLSHQAGTIYNICESALAVFEDQDPGAAAEFSEITSFARDVQSAAADTADQVDKHQGSMNRYFEASATYSLVFASAVLGLNIVGVLLSWCNARRGFTALLPLGMLLSIGSWVVFGALFAVRFLMEDACIAVDHYMENRCTCAPVGDYLADVLPCPDRATSQSLLNDAKGMTNSLLESINAELAAVPGGALPPLCEPFNTCEVSCSDGTTLTRLPQGQSCPDGTIDVADAENEYAPFLETAPPQLTQEAYDRIVAAAGAIQNMTSVGGAIATTEDVLQCYFAVEGFAEFNASHCGFRGLSKQVELLWVGFGIIAVCFTVVSLCWKLGAKRFGERGDLVEQAGRHQFEAELSAIAKGGVDPSTRGTPGMGRTVTNPLMPRT